MNFKLISIDPVERTVLIEWADGTTRNHNIPVERLRRMIGKGQPLIKDRPDAKLSIVAVIKRERL